MNVPQGRDVTPQASGNDQQLREMFSQTIQAIHSLMAMISQTQHVQLRALHSPPNPPQACIPPRNDPHALSLSLQHFEPQHIEHQEHLFEEEVRENSTLQTFHQPHTSRTTSNPVPTPPPNSQQNSIVQGTGPLQQKLKKMEEKMVRL